MWAHLRKPELKTQSVPRSKHTPSPLKNQSVNVVEGNNRRLFWDPYRTQKYTVGRMQNCWCTYSKHCAAKGKPGCLYPKRLAFAENWTNIPSYVQDVLYTRPSHAGSRGLQWSLFFIWPGPGTCYLDPQFIVTFKNSRRVQVRTINIVSLQNVRPCTSTDRWHPKRSARKIIS